MRRHRARDRFAEDSGPHRDPGPILSTANADRRPCRRPTAARRAGSEIVMISLNPTRRLPAAAARTTKAQWCETLMFSHGRRSCVLPAALARRGAPPRWRQTSSPRIPQVPSTILQVCGPEKRWPALSTGPGRRLEARASAAARARVGGGFPPCACGARALCSTVNLGGEGGEGVDGDHTGARCLFSSIRRCCRRCITAAGDSDRQPNRSRCHPSY